METIEITMDGPNMMRGLEDALARIPGLSAKEAREMSRRLGRALKKAEAEAQARREARLRRDRER